METRLFTQMTALERTDWCGRWAEFMTAEWPMLLPLTAQTGGRPPMTRELRDVMGRLLRLLAAWPFARDFSDKAMRYGDFSARAYRLPIYIKKVEESIERTADPALTAIAMPARASVSAGSASGNAPQPEKRKPGRPASAATLARREAEKLQMQMFDQPAGEPAAPAPPSVSSGSAVGAAPAPPTVPGGSAAGMSADVATPFIPPTSRDDTEYRLNLLQKRAFLSPELQREADRIGPLRTQAGAAAERAKTMADLRVAAEQVAPVAEEAQRTLEQVEQIYQQIDEQLAETWWRLQNGTDEWRTAWLRRYGYLKADAKADASATVPAGSPAGSTANGKTTAKGEANSSPFTLHSSLLHPDLIYDLRRHYKKVCERQPDFDARMRRQQQEEDPEFVAARQQEAANKKEVQDILRYLRRKDKGASEQRCKTAREKFHRLEQLLGKKEAATYRPLVTKIEDDYHATKK